MTGPLVARFRPNEVVWVSDPAMAAFGAWGRVVGAQPGMHGVPTYLVDGVHLVLYGQGSRWDSGRPVKWYESVLSRVPGDVLAMQDHEITELVRAMAAMTGGS